MKLLKRLFPTKAEKYQLKLDKRWSKLLLVLLFPLSLFSQGEIGKQMKELKAKGHFKEKPFVLFKASGVVRSDAANIVSKHSNLKMDDSWHSILNTKPEYLKMAFFGDTILLERSDINPVCNLKNESVSYHGAIDGKNTTASFTFSEFGNMGMITKADGNWIIGNYKGSDDYIYYNDRDLLVKQSFDCTARTIPDNSSHTGIQSLLDLSYGKPVTTISNKCIKVYWEVRNDMYLAKGEGTAAHMMGVFNQVKTLYANDGININLSELKIHTTPDGYTNVSDTYGLVYQFGTRIASGFNGDFAQLIGLGGGGGYAWINEYCDIPKFKTGVSNISSTYNTVPTYSWSVENLAHELGHLLGCAHTQSCAWNGNNTAIDGCAPVEGSCPRPPMPAKGTIMSYCHLNVGIDFNLGFGPQPRERIITRSNAATCLGTSCTPLPPPTCSTFTETRNIPCINGMTGQITERRTFLCPAGVWDNWLVIANTCVMPPTDTCYSTTTTPICPAPLQITCTITQRLNDVIVVRSGYTNYKYSWCKNGVKQSWTGQTVPKSLYTTGDRLKVRVSSTNTQTTTKCYIEGICQIIIQ